MGNTPKLRFEGFTEKWMTRTVSELLREKNEQAPESKLYPLMAFIGNVGVAPKGDRYDRSALVKDAKNKIYKKTELGDFIYSSNNLETGSIGLNNWGNASISPVYSVFGTTGIADPDFIGRRFVRRDFINMMVRYRQGVVYGQWKIHEQDFLRISVSVPVLDEQEVIGDFFYNLDNLINLYQSKYGALLKAKQFYLQTMFPQKGERVPKLRFEGFTGNWERHKLGELVKFSKGAGYSKADLRAAGTPIILYGRLYTNYQTIISDIDTFADAKEGSVFSCGGEVIVPASGETAEDISVAAVVNKSGVLLGGDLNIIIPPSSLDSAFLAIYISNGPPHFDMAKMAQGKSVVHLHNSDLATLDLIYPNYSEQVQISNYLNQLDSLITQQQRKVDAFKNMKQFMLQNMFV